MDTFAWNGQGFSGTAGTLPKTPQRTLNLRPGVLLLGTGTLLVLGTGTVLLLGAGTVLLLGTTRGHVPLLGLRGGVAIAAAHRLAATRPAGLDQRAGQGKATGGNDYKIT